MDRAPLGNTGLVVAKLGFGGIPIQRISEEEAIGVVRFARDMGIDFFDTAHNYDTSEERIGKALATCRGSVTLATKTHAREKPEVLREFHESLRRLRTDRIDLYQFHQVDTTSEIHEVLAPRGSMDELLHLRDSGAVGHIGMSTHKLEVARAALESGAFATVMVPLNYVEREWLRVAEEAYRGGTGVIVMKPFGGGALGGAEASAALKWVLGQEVHVVIPGMATRNEVRENVATATRSAGLGPDDLRALAGRAKQLGDAFCHRCGYCLPCPQGIDVIFIMGAKDYFQRSGWGRATPETVERLSAGLSCLACGTCEERCPYDLKTSELVQKTSAELIGELHARGYSV